MRGARRAKLRDLGGALLAGVLLTAGARADAEPVVDEDEPPPAYVPELRPAGRPVIGFSAGVGLFDATCSGCTSQTGLSVGLFGGWQLSPRVALLADGWAVVHILPLDDPQRGVITHILTVLAARVWLAPQLWIEAGPGGGWLARTGQGHDLGPGLMLAVGAEPGHKPCHGIDVSARFGGSRQLDGDGGHTLVYSIAGSVAFHWN